jgi:hypothetical protein
MSGELFEVAFSGKVSSTDDIDDVKYRVGQIFNADETKIAHLFSGRRIIIKKNIDRATAEKYRNAFTKAGAISEVKLMVAERSADVAVTHAAIADAPRPNEQKSAPVQSTPVPAKATVSAKEADGNPPPQIYPLGITGDKIPDLDVTVAPLGSAMRDKLAEVTTPTYDLSGFDVAPVGSQIDTSKKEADPPPPDTSGLSMAD